MYRSDRFLYLPLVGLALAAAMGLRPLSKNLKTRGAVTGVIGAGVLVLLVGEVLSSHQVRVWRDNISIWTHCVSVAPRSSISHHCLANHLAKAARFDLAISHYETSLKINPNDRITLDDYALQLSTCEDERLRDYDRAIDLAERACALSRSRRENSPCRTLALAYMNGATDLKGRGRFERAIEYYRKAIKADPTYEVPLFNLALLLATCSDEQFRQPDQAVRLAEQACRIMERPGSIPLSILAEVYGQTGRFEQATSVLREAIRIAETERQTEWSDELRHRLSLYQNRKLTSAQGNSVD